MRVLISKILGLFGRRNAEQEFDAEIQQHLSMLVEENLRKGMSPEEALRAARVHFGGVEQVKETRRELRGLPFAEALAADLRYAVRVLRKGPGFTIVSVLTLALGIGVNTTMFNAYNSVALKLLPVKGPTAVVRVQREWSSGSIGNYQYFFSYPEYTSLRDHNTVFSDLAAMSYPFFASARSGTGEPEKLRCALVSGNYFSSLGIEPELGHAIGPEENKAPGASPLVMLSHAYWERSFNADPAVLGKVIHVNDTSFTVIGVVPAEFVGTSVPPEPPDIWAPVMMQPQLLASQALTDASRNQRFVQLLARLKPSVARGQAAAETFVLLERFAAEHPAPPVESQSGGRLSNDKTLAIKLPSVTLFGNTDDPRFTVTFALLIALVGTILLIGCANLANMLMARASGRQREFAVRLAMGAGRMRLVRQLLTESILVGLLGGIAGIVLSAWTSWVLARVVRSLLADFFLTGTPLSIDTSLDWRVFAYAMTIAILAGVGFGLLPALRFSKPDLNSALKNEGSTLGRNLGGARMRGLLVAGQACVSIFLLVCAGLLTRGLIRSRAVRPGFETTNAFALNLDYGDDPKRAVALQRQVVERLQLLPELRGVVLSERIPLLGTWTPPVTIPPGGPGKQGISGRTGANRVGPEFFAAMGVPLLEGRTFTRRECEAQRRVAIISEAAARQFWPGRSPLGMRATLDMDFRGDYQEFEVIGVARDARHASLSRVDPAFFYFPARAAVVNSLLFTTNGDNRAATAAVRTTLESLDRNLTFSMLLINLERVPMRAHRLLARLSATFAITLAGLALALAAVGIHGVMAYLVSQRVKEIGIRMALGADAGNVVWLVVREGLTPVFIGSAVGLLAAAAISGAMHSQLRFPGTPDMLYGLHAYDPVTFIGLALFLALVAMIAAWAPARRATRVDPMIALRYE